MRVVVHGETDLEVDRFPRPELEVEVHGPEAGFSALQLFATSMALCTFSVLAAYGEATAVPADDIAMRLRWRYAERPYRIAYLQMEITWPGVPESRIAAATRAAEHCALHNTLAHPPHVETFIRRVANTRP